MFEASLRLMMMLAEMYATLLLHIAGEGQLIKVGRRTGGDTSFRVSLFVP